MKREFDVEYVHGLEQKVQQQAQVIRAWQFNGIYITPEEKYAVWAREAAEAAAQLEEQERRELERLDDELARLGF
ncbi:hypothetical protein [Lachnoclostridium edouardi]|uniref:hypothetical protein n=1 Tax=Lachnoclostridium edouardi TaxID=1926283 RepID=UPI000C7AEB2A|nr:hypothetical protein [Lachnoclostridium edouardi]